MGGLRDREPLTGQLLGYSLNVRSSSIDVLLVTLGLGSVISLIGLFLIYLLVRTLRKRQPSKHYHQSKADRPSWVAGLIFSGSVWIVMGMMAAGVIIIEPETLNACSIIKFVGEYWLGYVLWISLVLYKLIRKYFQLRLVGRKPPHALLAIAILMIPYGGLSIASSISSNCERDDLDVCHWGGGGEETWSWIWPMYTVLLLYAGLFIFFLSKIQKTIGNHHELIRYSIFLSTSFIFPVVDAIIQLSPLVFKVSLQQLVVLLIIITVIVNLGHIFVLILKGKGQSQKSTGILPPNGGDNLREPVTLTVSSLSSLSTSAPPPPPPVEMKSSALDDINVILSESPVEKRMVNTENVPPILLRRPRRSDEDEMLPDYEQFVDGLPEDLAIQIDRNRGFFAYRSRPRTRTIVEFDLERAARYLEADSTDSNR